MQRLFYHRRRNIAQQYSSSKPEKGKSTDDAAAKLFVEKKKQSLHDLYAPASMKVISDTNLLRASEQDSSPEVQALVQK